MAERRTDGRWPDGALWARAWADDGRWPWRSTAVTTAFVLLGSWARDRAQLVVLAYESGLVRPGWLG